MLQYTGGTTGLPRAAMLTHANLTARRVASTTPGRTASAASYAPGDRVMCVLPLFHIYALTAVLLRAVATGVEIMLRPRFDRAAALDDIEHGRCTHFSGVPTMWIALVNAARASTKRDLSALRVASSGGAAAAAGGGRSGSTR